MYSMTGYGRGEATNGDVTVVVELKTVNNRFRDINLRLPREYLVLEPRIHGAIKGPIRRGRVEAFVRRSAADSNQTVRPDPILAEHYLRAISAVAKRLQRDPSEVSLDFVLSQPGVLTVADGEHDALSEWDLLHTALVAALADLKAMRGTEGEALRRDLARHAEELQRLRGEVADAADGINERLVHRLNLRFEKLLGDRVEPARLAQEAAILADKADVSEELLRIQSHLEQFHDALDSEKPVGRKLEFLVQELNREVNTVGSKAAEHPISARVVEMKSVLERLREQAANVE